MRKIYIHVPGFVVSELKKRSVTLTPLMNWAVRLEALVPPSRTVSSVKVFIPARGGMTKKLRQARGNRSRREQTD